MQVSAAEPNAKIIPGHTWSFTVRNERGRNQRYNYVFESCKVPQEGNWVCRRHCRWGAELSRWQNNTVQKTRYTPAGKMGPVLPCFCCLVYRERNYTLLQTRIYPQSLASHRKTQNAPGFVLSSWKDLYSSLLYIPSYTEDQIIYNRRSARM